MKNNIPTPIIFETKYSKENADNIESEIKNSVVNDPKLLIDYPTVYVINTNEKPQTKYTVYVGETTNIKRRTLQHLEADPKDREDWMELKNSDDVHMYVIGHKHFNKSLTLDIENRMMQYLSGVEAVKHLNNRRTNDQNQYYPVEEFPIIFRKIWRKLNKRNNRLFPALKIIENTALFKASPFNKLTNEQLAAKQKIRAKIDECLIHPENVEDGTLILVEGNAGSGKTVLMSNLFYELKQDIETYSQDARIKSICLMVNHEEQYTVYKQIARKLGFPADSVLKPSTFINDHKPENKVDVAIVDEAHLLLTQRSQGYHGHGDNQLLDIIKRAKIVLAVYDPMQVLQAREVWDENKFESLEKIAGEGNIIYLKNQMRINASKDTINWIRNLVDKGVIGKIPDDSKYEIKVFKSPKTMQEKIEEKAQDQAKGLSRMVATFDWDYSGQSRPKNHRYWEVSEGDWSMPWNNQLKSPRKKGIVYSNLSWPEKDYTINEIGSTYTVQGLDLNYVGVEIGPSIKYRNGKIVIDASASSNKKAVQKRESKTSYAEHLLRNELNVLLTRGVHGLYIHAVDQQLQEALEKAAGEGKII